MIFFIFPVDIVLSLDYIPITSSQPRARSRALETRGRPEGGGGDALPRLSGPVRRHPAGWGGGRDADSQSAHGGPSRMVPARQPRVTGIGRPRICFPSADAAAESLQRWVGAGPRDMGKGDGA